MKTSIKIILLIISISLFNIGCTSNKISLNTAKPYEGRYTTNDVIQINDVKIDMDDSESIWILTSTTLNNLLQYSSGNNIQEIE